MLSFFPSTFSVLGPLTGPLQNCAALSYRCLAVQLGEQKFYVDRKIISVSVVVIAAVVVAVTIVVLVIVVVVVVIDVDIDILAQNPKYFDIFHVFKINLRASIFERCHEMPPQQNLSFSSKPD